MKTDKARKYQMCNGILWLSLLILPTPPTLCTVKLQFSSALLPSSSYDKSRQYNKIKESHGNSFPSTSNLRKHQKGWVTENNPCKWVILSLKLSTYFLPKLAFLVLECQYIYLLINLVKITKRIFFHCGEQQK